MAFVEVSAEARSGLVGCVLGGGLGGRWRGYVTYSVGRSPTVARSKRTIYVLSDAVGLETPRASLLPAERIT